MNKLFKLLICILVCVFSLVIFNACEENDDDDDDDSIDDDDDSIDDDSTTDDDYDDGPYSNEEAKLVPSDPEMNDQFGYSIAIDGSYAIVGVPQKAIDAKLNVGVAYIFHAEDKNKWDDGTKLTAPFPLAGERFGSSVSISGDYAVVGTPSDSWDGTGAGAAYIFHRTDTNVWASIVRIEAPDAEAYANFGRCVDISKNYIIVGASGEDFDGEDSGAAYIFRRTGDNTWDQGSKITASDSAMYHYFGWKVAIFSSIGGDYAAVAKGDCSAVYIFHRTGTNTWDSETKIASPEASKGVFGSTLDIYGERVIVGSDMDDTAEVNAGAAYVFHRTGTNSWDSGTKILAPDAHEGDKFGSSVAINDDYAIIGAPYKDVVDHTSGAAYIFHSTGENSWDSGIRILGKDTQSGDMFGTSVAISNDYAMAGVPNDSYEGIADPGSAYIFQ